MKLAHITPIPLLHRILSKKDRFHLVLSSHIQSSDEYRTFYADRMRAGDYVIMDSPAFELRDAVNWKEHFDMVKLFYPNEVVLPDDMESDKRTLKMTKDAALRLREQGFKGSMMAVPHGKTIEAYLDNAIDLCNVPGVSVLGIQEEVEELYGVDRPYVAEMLHYVVGIGTQLHYLGFTEGLKELLPQARAHIRSADSGKIVTYGLCGLEASPESAQRGLLPPYPGRAALGGRMKYFDYDTNSQELIDMARWNIAQWRELHEGATRV